MLATGRRRLTVAVVLLLLLLLIGFAAYLLTRPPARAGGSATLTVFLGSLQLQRSGSTAFTDAHTGDEARGGDTLRTGDSSKAAINFPDGSVTRLDSNTSLTVRKIEPNGSSLAVELYQGGGKTFSSVQQLTGGSTFKVDGPNSTTAAVRGTEFLFIVSGSTVTVAVFSGSIDFTAGGKTVTVGAGQESSSTNGGPPTTPGPISNANQTDTFTLFNLDLDAAPGPPVAFATGVLAAPGSASGSFGTEVRYLTLNWEGSEFAIELVGSSKQVRSTSSEKHPLTMVVPCADQWKYNVKALKTSKQGGEIWWLILSKATKTDLPLEPCGPPASPSPSPQVRKLPDVTGVNPATGPSGGGTRVVISGSNFTGTSVSFGSTPAASFTVDSDSQITAISPAHDAGTVDVTVTTAVGTSLTGSADQFTFVAPPPPPPPPPPPSPPVVTSVSPPAGPIAGGTRVTISGSNFTGTSVSFGGTAGTIVSNNGSTILADSPAHAAATVDVTVTTTVGTSATSSADQFTFLAPPAVSGVSPATGPAVGGTSVTISGANFAFVTSVTFGGTAATFTVNSATQITATSLAHVSGPFDVLVTTLGGTSAATRIDLFTFTNWTDMAPATLPTSRVGAAIAYDAARNQTVLFGGSPVSFGNPGETWIWDGANWAKMSPASAPTSRVNAAMAYDPVSQKVVLVGGDTCGDNCTSSDVWAWNGSNWTQVTTPNAPPARNNAALAHTANALVLFGGSLQNDTWVSTDGGANWTQKQATNALCTLAAPCATQPAIVYHPALTDAPGGTILLFEGDSFSAADQTWVWNGSSWAAFTGAAPANRALAALAYDRLRGKVVLFGGYQQGIVCTLPCPIVPLNDTWLWDGATWTQDSPVTSPPLATAPPPPALPIPRTSPLLGGDPRGGVVLFDGGPNDTWGYV